MNIECIDEVEQLIQQFRDIQAANAALTEIREHASDDCFAIRDESTLHTIELPGMKTEIVAAIQAIVDDKYAGIMRRLDEI